MQFTGTIEHLSARGQNRYSYLLICFKNCIVKTKPTLFKVLLTGLVLATSSVRNGVPP